MKNMTVGLAAAAALAVLATACGGSTSSSASAPTYAQEVALAQCMRSHGVPDFPDPNSSGSYTLTSNGSIEGAGGAAVDVNSSQAQKAYGDCRHLLPGGPSIAQLEQMEQQAQQRRAKELPELLRFSQCMRGHGVPNFPDFGSSQSPPPGGGAALDPNTPQFKTAEAVCQHLLPPGAKISVNPSGSAQ
jgi:hypothetical protein